MKAIAAVLALATALATPMYAVPVDVELVLAADVSGSLSTADFNLQRDGYAAAFNSPSLVSAIQAGAIGSIAVTLVYWSDSAVQSIGWTLINDATTAAAFATSIATTTRPSSGSTRMTNALNYSAGLFDNNGYEGTRNVIDVSGDGSESIACSFNALDCAPLQAARDAFLATGGSINALWIADPPYFGGGGEIIDALVYGLTNVIGGPGSFQSIVTDFDGFTKGIENKLVREVSGEVPEPSTYLLMLGGLGLLALRRRNRS